MEVKRKPIRVGSDQGREKGGGNRKARDVGHR